jgi:hypothetical protein
MSTSMIESVSGTVFALAPTGVDPPVTTATVDPPPNRKSLLPAARDQNQDRDVHRRDVLLR